MRQIGKIMICALAAAMLITPVTNIAVNCNPADSHDKPLAAIESETAQVYDEIDQQQTIQKTGAILSGEFSWAQSFKPTMENLTRVEILISKWGPSKHNNIKVHIRSFLGGDNLASGFIAPSQVLKDTFRWITVDFKDITVTPGNKYFIVCETTRGYPDDDYSYKWGCSNCEAYPYGDMYLGRGNRWHKRENNDLCFKTYGHGKSGLEITRIRGGFGISALLTNTGEENIQDISWCIDYDVFIERFQYMGGSSGSIFIESIPAGGTKRIFYPLVLGFGSIAITVTAAGKIETVSGYIAGPFVFGVWQGTLL